MDISVATILKERRKFLRKSVKEVIEELKDYNITIAAPTLYGYENGHNRPDAAILAALFEIYGIKEFDSSVPAPSLADEKASALSASRVKRVREANGFTYTDVAAQLGISVEMYVDIENGDATPTNDWLIRIAICLHVSKRSLLEGTDSANASIKYGLRHYMELQGVSTEALSQLSHFPVELLMLYETGDYTPDSNSIKKLALVLNVDCNSLFIPRAYWPSFDTIYRNVTLTEEEFQIVYAYRNASTEDRRKLAEIANAYPSLASAEEKLQIPGIDEVYATLHALSAEEMIAHRAPDRRVVFASSGQSDGQ